MLRAVLWVVLDLCVAAVVAVVFWANVGITGQSDTNPPTCTTASGTIDCSLEGPLRAAQVVVFLAVLAGLVTWQVIRARRRAPSATTSRG